MYEQDLIGKKVKWKHNIITETHDWGLGEWGMCPGPGCEPRWVSLDYVHVRMSDCIGGGNTCCRL
jgi:hypothetical protein